MKILSVALLLLASLAFVVLGCSDNSAPIVAPSDEALSTSASPAALAKGAVLASASGSAQMYLDADGNPTLEKSAILRVCTFNAREYAGESYSGEFIMLGAPGPKQTFSCKAEILQVKVQGNKAKMVFKILRAGGGLSGLEGINGCYVVVDNGEGNKAEPDLNSPFYFIFPPEVTQTFLDMTPDAFLAFLPTVGYPGLVPINLGNVQVRGNSYQ
jgi:hypothetical protein